MLPDAVGLGDRGLQGEADGGIPLVEGLLTRDRRFEQVRTEGGGRDRAGRQVQGCLDDGVLVPRGEVADDAIEIEDVGGVLPDPPGHVLELSSACRRGVVCAQ